MNIWVAVWLFFRALRWVGIIAFLIMSIVFVRDRASYLTAFGQLQHWVESVFYLSGLAFVIAGLFELMTREKAGLPRPALGEIIPRARP